jgi:3-methyladenine DNA glycosylase AlkD
VPVGLPVLRRLIVTHSWWDTVDALASHSVGPLVRRQPELARELDDWSVSENLWLRRTALIYQLGYKERTDAARLFAYVDRMAHEKEFFIRKAIGWALRQYARTAPAEVKAFLLPRRQKLSGLSWREATKHLSM